MTQKYKTLADAIRLAEFAHFNQVDKAGLPYIEHPKRVLAKVQAQGALPYVQMAAILHDVTEDTAFTPDMLLSLGIPESAVEIVKLLDRGHSERRFNEIVKNQEAYFNAHGNLGEYPNYLHNTDNKDDFYYKEISLDKNAVLVKLADIEDNLSPWRLSYLSDETQKRLREKYAKALEILNPKPVNHGFITDSPMSPFVPGWYH